VSYVVECDILKFKGNREKSVQKGVFNFLRSFYSLVLLNRFLSISKEKKMERILLDMS
jgi:hypothetical protein